MTWFENIGRAVNHDRKCNAMQDRFLINVQNKIELA